MANGFHIEALRSGIAAAVTTGEACSAELFEFGAASSIRWKGEPPPPQIIVACSSKNRQGQFPLLKAAKPKADDDGLYSSIKKALDRAETEDPSLTCICNKLKRCLVFMPQSPTLPSP
jgi:hypothetical protein